MNISLLAGLPLSALAFVLRANPSRAAEAGGWRLDASLRSLLESQRAAGAIDSAEEAVFRASQADLGN